MNTNAWRAQRAAEALLHHAQFPDHPQDTLGAQDVLELLVDLRHFCEARKIDFYSVLDASYQAYLEEREAVDEDEL